MTRQDVGRKLNVFSLNLATHLWYDIVRLSVYLYLSQNVVNLTHYCCVQKRIKVAY